MHRPTCLTVLPLAAAATLLSGWTSAALDRQLPPAHLAPTAETLCRDGFGNFLDWPPSILFRGSSRAHRTRIQALYLFGGPSSGEAASHLRAERRCRLWQ